MAVLYGKNYGKPTLDLNFAGNKSLVDTTTEKNYVTFSRAQSGNEATYIGSDGLIKYAAADEARFDHDPATGESLGLLIEEGRTNYFTNSTPTSTGWGEYNGSSITDNQATGPNGVTNSASLVTFPATGGAIPIIGESSAGVSGTVTVSMYVRAVTGTVSLQVGTNLAYGTTQIVGTSWTRIQFTTSTLGSSAGLRSGDVNSAQNFYAWGGQLEVGTFPTSYIPTSGGTATRATDIATIEGTNFSSWYNQSEGTVFVEANNLPYGGGLYYFGPTGAPRWWSRYERPNGIRTQAYDGVAGSGVVDLTVPGVSNNETIPTLKHVIAIDNVAEEQVGATNGSSVLNGSWDNVSGVTALRLGHRQDLVTSGFLNGHISRLTYYPKRLPDIELQQLTK